MLGEVTLLFVDSKEIFSLTTAPQILRVEGGRLTIALMYGIITAEKIYAELDFRFFDCNYFPTK